MEHQLNTLAIPFIKVNWPQKQQDLYFKIKDIYIKSQEKTAPNSNKIKSIIQITFQNNI